MRIAAWNCNMRFRHKINHVLDLSVQLAVISECENLEKLKEGQSFEEIRDSIWIGDNPNKGIGVFSFSDMSLEIAPWYDPEFKYIVPIYVKDTTHSFLLFAIWACRSAKSKFSYIEQVYQAISYYAKFTDFTNTLLVGDFNSNAVWDKKHTKYGSHSMVVDFLRQKKW